MAAQQDDDHLEEGVVITATGSWYEVQAGERRIPSRVPGRFRLEDRDQTNPVVLGDHVIIRIAEDNTGMITEVLPRRNKLSRRAAGRRVGLEHLLVANVDFAWVVQSARRPKFNPGFVDRVLVMAAVNEIPAGLVINKLDLIKRAERDKIDEWTTLYRNLGHPVLLTSALTGEGVKAFGKALAGQVSVVSGPSGVGKSTLLNAVDPDLALRTGDISEATQKGKHTTTNASLHRLSNGGIVADTPGLREFGLVDLDPDHLSHRFPEFVPLIPACRFPNCTHDHEPDCAVKDAVDEGELSIERYDSYLGMLYSLRLGDQDTGR